MGKNLNDSTTSSTTDDTSHKKKKIEYINISSLSWKENKNANMGYSRSRKI